MSEVWETLIQVQDMLINELTKSGEEIYEPGMERFNQPGWINRVWSGDKYRRAHIDVVDARNSRGLWMMHCCIFPNLHNNSPIFGLDVIAGKNKITGFFHDYSPSVTHDHPMIDDFENAASLIEWTKQRELPDWAKAIFTPYMISAGNVKNTNELEQIIDFSTDSIYNYLQGINDFDNMADPEEVKKSHNRYAYYQKQNPHTPRTMKALGLNDDDVDAFIGQCLFPEI